MADERIIVRVDFDTTKSKKAFDKVERNAKTSGKKAGAVLGKGINAGLSGAISTGAGAAALGALGAAALAAAKSIQFVTREAKEAFTAMRGFGRSIAEVNTLLGDNERVTKATKNTLAGFSAEFASTKQQQAKAFYSIISAGVKGTSKQLRVLRTANIAATAGLVDINTSAFALVSSVNAYSKAGLTATKASDALFVAVREGQTTFGELASSIGRVAPLASSVGVKFGDLTGVLAFLTKQGISTAEATTGLKSILSNVVKPSEQAKEAAKRLGIEFNTAAIKSKGFVGFLNEIRKASGGNEQVLAQLFPSVEALSSIIAITTGDFKDFKDILIKTNTTAGVTAKQLKKIQESLDFKTDRASRQIDVFFGQLIGKTEGFSQAAADSVFTFAKSLTIAQSETIRTKDALDAADAQINKLRESAEKISKGELRVFPKDEDLTEAIRLREEGIRSVGASQIAVERRSVEINEELNKLLEKRKRLENEFKKAQEEEAGLLGIPQSTEEPDEEDAGDKALKAGEKVLQAKSMFQEFADALPEVDIGLNKNAESFEMAGKKIASVMKNFVVKTISQGIQTTVKALLFGEDGFKNFGKKVLQNLGKMAIQIGEIMIATGLSMAALTLGGPGATIAAGAALIAVGTIVSKLAGGTDALAAPTPGGAVGAGDTFTSPEDLGLDQPEIAEPETTVSVTIQGDVLDSDETGSRVVQLINDAFDKDGVVINKGVVA